MSAMLVSRTGTESVVRKDRQLPATADTAGDGGKGSVHRDYGPSLSHNKTRSASSAAQPAA